MGSFFITILSILSIIVLNIIQIKNHPNKILRCVCLILFLFTGLRYVALIIYASGAHISILKFFSYFYYASAIGITIPSALALWYIIPRFREKIKEWILLLLLSPFILFHLNIILLQPTQIIKNTGFGYELLLMTPWNKRISIVQALFTLIVLIVCYFGFRWYKYKFPRSQYLLFALGYTLTTIDGICILFNTAYPLEPFILSEAFILIAILYAFSTKPIKEQYKK